MARRLSKRSLIMAATAGLALMPSAAQATFPGENGQVAFDYTVSAVNHSSYRIDPATGNLTGFAFYTGGRLGQSSWSPDGTKLAIVSEGVVAGHGGIWVWDTTKDTTNGADPGESTQITPDLPPLSGPAWSPDGKQIAYSDGADVYRVDAVPSAIPVNLTADTSVTITEPDWSPDGTRIAFTALPSGGDFDVYTMNATDGANKFNVTHNPAYDSSPSWSPDGTKLAFMSRRDDAAGDIYTTLADGSGTPFRVEARANIPDTAPSWSPDGTKLAFSSAVPTTGDPGRRDIYLARADGTGDPVTMPGSFGRDDNPAWGRVTPKCHGLTPTILGTEAGETLNGTAGNDVILGMGGNDVITGSDGDDTICGGNGNDTLVGGGDADWLDGGAGIDTVSYSDRSEVLRITLDLGTGDDGSSLDGGPGERDNIVGVEKATGGSGNDLLIGNTSANTLTGLGGNDTLLGGVGNDSLSGGPGDDTLNGSTGADRFDGGTGIDTVSYTDRNSTTIVTIDNIANDGYTADGPATARDNVLGSVENLTGGGGNDTLKGSSIANRIIGMAGADRFYGLGGNDTLQAKDGIKDVLIDGSTGTDVVGRDSIDPAPVNVP
jgi:Tol biopolymer transport system component